MKTGPAEARPETVMYEENYALTVSSFGGIFEYNTFKMMGVSIEEVMISKITAVK